jgi:hypothetical protein
MYHRHHPAHAASRQNEVNTMKNNNHGWREGVAYEAMVFDNATILVIAPEERLGTYFTYPVNTTSVNPAADLRATLRHGPQGWEIETLRSV